MFVCVCTHVCTCVYVCVYTHICMQVDKSQRSALSFFCSFSLHYFLRQSLSMGLEPTELTGRSARKAQASSCLCFLSSRIAGTHHHI